MRTMRYFMTGRLAEYERMMQDNGESYRSRCKNAADERKNQTVAKDMQIHKPTMKAGDTYAGNKS
ncbi:MAG: hypothetical protein Q4B26_13585 [Eubacteriales bacterium]|nr:hypothetical protein [Eubacteriales bacterium]